ncbi:hypothetical protein [Halorubrum sp. Ib24]|uniref:hypothetical protein n=1 Tax=Halorubrum sp. Ib24 TaxID=1383850 RepID=UPI00117AAB5A|nr:hypothetical protein [Halorubrum sp. Ib24]
MTENIGTLLATLLVGALVVVAIVLAFLGYDPSVAGDIFIPLFLIAVFLAISVGLFKTALS